MAGPALRGAIVAMSRDGVIGLDGKIPWHYAADLKRFKRQTFGTTIIMGRHTWESIGAKPLPGRRNIVITRATLKGVDCFASIEDALASCAGPIWFIGGAEIYREALDYCDVLDVTYVPDRIDHLGAVRFPEIDPEQWEAGPMTRFDDDVRLTRRIFRRRIRGTHGTPRPV